MQTKNNKVSKCGDCYLWQKRAHSNAIKELANGLREQLDNGVPVWMKGYAPKDDIGLIEFMKTYGINGHEEIPLDKLAPYCSQANNHMSYDAEPECEKPPYRIW